MGMPSDVESIFRESGRIFRKVECYHHALLFMVVGDNSEVLEGLNIDHWKMKTHHLLPASIRGEQNSYQEIDLKSEVGPIIGVSMKCTSGESSQIKIQPTAYSCLSGMMSNIWRIVSLISVSL